MIKRVIKSTMQVLLANQNGVGKRVWLVCLEGALYTRICQEERTDGFQ